MIAFTALIVLIILAIINVKRPLSLWYFSGTLLVAAWLIASQGSIGALLVGLLMASLIAVFGLGSLRKRLISRPLFQRMKKSMPPISDTEEVALKAGDLWWDEEIFSGRLNWQTLSRVSDYTPSPEEQAFLSHQVPSLCAMVNNHSVRRKGDLPEQAWNYIKQEKFLGMVIPKQYGGLGFSHSVHAEVVIRLSSRSSALGVTVMVPNSLGPGELLLKYGTDQQKNKYLPKLASAEEIPCFALTSTVAGSDAGSIVDNGIICKRRVGNRSVIGILLNWEKRYITLSPIATLLGLAFKAYDPDHLLPAEHPLHGQSDLGISCALIPTDTAGISIGSRHNPLGVGFMNGPNQGKDVFIALDDIIGGPAMLGQGWRMLMECLSIGRSISLPGSGTAGCQMSLLTAAAYSNTREQFNMPVGRFLGITEKLSELVLNAFRSKANSVLTTSALDAHINPSIISAIVKFRNTEMCRQSILNSQDIHAGKAIIAGPKNYLADGFLSFPFGITVEGANILSRTLMTFGQGVTRCHPFVYQEMQALYQDHQEVGIDDFDQLLVKHISHSLTSFLRLPLINLGLNPVDDYGSDLAPHYKQIARASAQFATSTDFALLLLQGELKRQEMISGLFADSLASIYEATSSLRYFQKIARQGDPESIKRLRLVVDLSIKQLMSEHRRALHEVLKNLPLAKPIQSFLCRWILGTIDGGRPQASLSHKQRQQLSDLCLDVDWIRQFLAPDCYIDDDPKDVINEMLAACKANQALRPIKHKLRQANSHYQPYQSFDSYCQQLAKDGILNQQEIDQWKQARALIFKAVSVDSSRAKGRLHTL